MYPARVATMDRYPEGATRGTTAVAPQHAVCVCVCLCVCVCVCVYWSNCTVSACSVPTLQCVHTHPCRFPVFVSHRFSGDFAHWKALGNKHNLFWSAAPHPHWSPSATRPGRNNPYDSYTVS